MKPGDAIDYDGMKVIGVPGGWLWCTSMSHATVVPFDNEFQPKREDDDLSF
jgi:hypothetical protein